MHVPTTRRETVSQPFIENPDAGLVANANIEVDNDEHPTDERGIWSPNGDPFDAQGGIDVTNWGNTPNPPGTKRAMPRTKPQDDSTDVNHGTEEMKISDDVVVKVIKMVSATTNNMTYTTPTASHVEPAMPVPVSRLQSSQSNDNRMMASSFDTSGNVRETAFGVGIGLGILMIIGAIAGIDFYRKRHPKRVRRDPEGDAKSKSEHGAHNPSDASSGTDL